MELDRLVARRVAANELDLALGTIQNVRQQLNQRLIRGGVHGRRGDGNSQFISQRLADFVAGRARLKFDGE